MEVITKEQNQTYYDMFDIMDTSKKETNLAKILAYIISKNPYALKRVVDVISGENTILKNKRGENILKKTSIEIEHFYTKDQLRYNNESGRTDIEIKIYDDSNKLITFIVFECKIHKNKATIDQYEKYKNIFNLNEIKEAKQKYFVYLSNQSGINLLGEKDLVIMDLNWRELINSLYDIQDKNHQYQSELKSFINYYERSYGMSNQREILIQDIGVEIETKRFFNGVYRRNKVNGSPLYFAPYFTRSNQTVQKEGISYISKILGIITTNDIFWEKIENSCIKFIDLFSKHCEYRSELLENWKKGIFPDVQTNNDILKQKKLIENMISEKKQIYEKNYTGKYAKSRDNLTKEITELEKLFISGDEKITEYWKNISYTYYFLDKPVEWKWQAVLPLLRKEKVYHLGKKINSPFSLIFYMNLPKGRKHARDAAAYPEVLLSLLHLQAFQPRNQNFYSML